MLICFYCSYCDFGLPNILFCCLLDMMNQHGGKFIIQVSAIQKIQSKSQTKKMFHEILFKNKCFRVEQFSSNMFLIKNLFLSGVCYPACSKRFRSKCCRHVNILLIPRPVQNNKPTNKNVNTRKCIVIVLFFVYQFYFCIF